MLRALAVLAVLSLVPACRNSESAPPAGGGDATRTPLVGKDHPLYARFEGTGHDNACSGDAQCAKGGCSGEICSAVKDVAGTCEGLPQAIPASASCGCVASECIWFSTDGSTLAASPGNSPPQPGQAGVPCGDQTCAPHEECIEYYGIAGPRGPKFQQCGIPCRDGQCPEGKKCVTIADGPGPVCQ